MLSSLLRSAAGVALSGAAILSSPTSLAAPPASSPAAASASEPLKIAPVQYRTRTLANGLQVITVHGEASPTVSVQVWYHVGSRNDPAGRSGFAHLFEHLMFKSTRYLKAEQFDRMTEDVGGENNAFTSSDVTVYHEVVPSNHLQTLLWAEAERMQNLNIDDANFRSERAVVEEEYRQRGCWPRPTAGSPTRSKPIPTCSTPTGARLSAASPISTPRRWPT